MLEADAELNPSPEREDPYWASRFPDGSRKLVPRSRSLELDVQSIQACLDAFLMSVWWTLGQPTKELSDLPKFHSSLKGLFVFRNHTNCRWCTDQEPGSRSQGPMARFVLQVDGENRVAQLAGKWKRPGFARAAPLSASSFGSR